MLPWQAKELTKQLTTSTVQFIMSLSNVREEPNHMSFNPPCEAMDEYSCDRPNPQQRVARPPSLPEGDLLCPSLFSLPSFVRNLVSEPNQMAITKFRGRHGGTRYSRPRPLHPSLRAR